MTATIHQLIVRHRGYKIYPVNAESSFQEVDDALYYFESPFYRYCATGGGQNPQEHPGWDEERERLTRLWQSKCPYPTPVVPKELGLWDSIKALFK